LFEAALIAVLLPATLVPLFRDDAWTREGRRAAWVPAGEPPFVVEESGRLHAALGPLVAELEPNAIVFCEWSHLYVFYYIAHVEQQRTDLMFLQAYPAIGQRRLADSARTLIRKELAGRPIYAAERMPELSDEFEFEAVERGGRTLFRVIERREH
jgi:hypothetical protein